MSFSDSDEEKLINSVAKYSVVYDAGHEEYRNVLVKDNVWRAIAQELNKTSEDCKKKWKFLRDGYQRFKKKSKLGTGSAASKNSKTKRQEQLSFLDSVAQYRSGGTNITLTSSQTVIQESQEDSGDRTRQLDLSASQKEDTAETHTIGNSRETSVVTND
ncbi:transcription factor Adf-1-like [Schistocerca piceifrons]|uniref:transcription factor Adf-1-like n=1 Tax=Schistocerca piceifrons TaxID=274613 RepID=UPI001F5F1AED|nr:transcription factor Adf-1-like [Schistocerca piceifrons]